MRKVYPYLNNPYGNNLNTQRDSRTFLQKIDDFVNQKQYIRITLLDWQENGIKEIEGELTGGSITKDGASSVRRTCNFQATVSGTTYNVEDMEMDFAINKKVFIEVGVKNYTDEYPEYPIIWFPQGVFFISSVNLSSSATSQVNIALQLKDKMCNLNGEIGGTFTATTILDEVDTQQPDGTYATEKIKVIEIITEVVNHFGGEPLTNIVIEDVPPRIQRVMRWMGDTPLWMKQQGNVDTGIYYQVEVEPPDEDNSFGWYQYVNGDDVGYIYDDFFYTGELVMAPGDNVCTALDALVQYLGNFEYFYDEFGVFHFREIKNYMNTTQASIVGFEAAEYLTDITTGKSTFNFSDDHNLISITANPQYSNIKNDYVVQGLRQGTMNNASYPVRYHLAIDYKPTVGNTYRDLILYKSPTDGLVKAMFPLHVEELPEVGNFNIFYMIGNDPEQIWFWSQNLEYVPIEPIIYYPPDENTEGYVTKDWRTEIYLRGLLARDLGTDASQYFTNLTNNKANGTGATYPWIDNIFNTTKHENIDIDLYYTELNAFWPEIYDLENQRFWAEEDDKSLQHTSLTDGNYYLDFIDPSTTGMGQFCINNIGRRTVVVNNEQINCLFEPTFPNINFLNLDEDDIEEHRNECITTGQPYTQVHGEIFNALSTGGYHFACFDEIKYQLYLHTNYAKTLSLIALPAFYLDVNERCTINDKSTNTYGDFVISNVTIPFGAGQSMSVSCSEATLDRYE